MDYPLIIINKKNRKGMFTLRNVCKVRIVQRKDTFFVRGTLA